MATTLAALRARLAQADSKNNTKPTQPQTDNVVYPHWNIDVGMTATLRFLPDADQSNDYFWVERNQIKLPFNGVKGESNSRRVEVTVPCMNMYGESCPILAEVSPWYKDKSLREMADKYWKKRSYLFEGFVRSNPIAGDKEPANPIRRFIMKPSIFTVIKASLLDPELENLPTDYVSGLDFNVKKTTKGEYADYATSNWARKETALTEKELAAINAFGLFNLREFLPNKPTAEDQRILMEMFEASVDGKAYDNERWGNFYRPWGVDAPTNAGGSAPRVETYQATQQVQQPVVPQYTAPVVQEDTVAPWEESAPVAAPVVQAPASSDKASELLALIRARQTQK